MSVHFKQQVEKLARDVENSQKLAIPMLLNKLTRCHASYPEDQTIGAMTQIVNRMAQNNNLFIRRAELKDLYNRLYTRNTKFAELFQEEIGKTESALAPTVVPSYQAGAEIDMYHGGDEILSNALNSVFDNTVALKEYSQKVSDQAIQAINRSLDEWQLKPHKLAVEQGNSNFLILKADYETPKGLTSFYIPLEVRNNKISQACVFLGNGGIEDLNHTNVKNYVLSHCGTKLKINAAGMLDLLTKAASEKRVISQTELALTRLNASRQVQSEYFSNNIVGQKLADNTVKDVEVAKAPGFESFEAKFNSPAEVAAFVFGDKVKIAADNIARRLVSFGYNSPSITVLKSDKHNISYGVSLDSGKVAFTVPVKIENNKVSYPGLMICKGSINNLSQENINKLYVDNQTDFKVAAAASPMFGKTPSALVHQIKQAMAQGNHAKAEDALNVLANAEDPKAYAIGLGYFMQGLSGKQVEATSKCSRMVKNSSSQHMICSHTGLPVHKVYQDKDGNCLPLYRQSMDENYQGAYFMSAKILG